MTSTNLPIFAYVDEATQVAELREYLIKCGAKLAENGKGDGADQILELCKEVRAVGTAADTNAILQSLNSLASLVVPMPKLSKEAVDSLCDGLSDPAVFSGSGLGSKAYAAFCILSNLFHGFQSLQPRLQYSIYCSMLVVAGRGGFMAEVPTEMTTVKEWFTAWKLTVEERRNVLRLMHAGVAKGGDEADSAAEMTTLLSTFTAEDAAEATNDARTCVIDSIADPATFLYDHLLQLDPVKSLQSAEPKLYQLLTILVKGSLKDYLAFQTKEKAFLANLKLSEEAMVYKMRILTLMTLAESKSEIGFAELSEVLSMGADQELEEFVIQATLTKAIRCRIDQVGQRLIILGAQSRSFEKKEWELLGQKLEQWAANLKVVKSTLDAVVMA